MKTIATALKDEIHYPVSDGFITNRLLVRDLNGDDEANGETLRSSAFIGAVADCLVSLIQAPDLAEDEVKITLQDRDAILRRANYLYGLIDEDPVSFSPRVYVGGRHRHEKICPRREIM